MFDRAAQSAVARRTDQRRGASQRTPLVVGRTDDREEHEADALADDVVESLRTARWPVAARTRIRRAPDIEGRTTSIDPKGRTEALVQAADEPDAEAHDTRTDSLAVKGVAKSLADATASAAAPADASPLQALADTTARALIAAAAAAEPAVTAVLTKLAADHGGRLEGLDHRLKTAASLSRKLADRVGKRANPGDPAADMAAEAAKMNDVLRYTLIVPEAKYGGAEAKVRAEMVKLTHELKNHWNAWGDPKSTGYKGINMTFNTPSGQLFELQVHTKASFATKQVIHAQYEEWRAADTSDERRAELSLEMAGQWRRIQVPTGAVAAPKTKPAAAAPPKEAKRQKKTYPKLKVLLAKAAKGGATRAQLDEGREFVKGEQAQLAKVPDELDQTARLTTLRYFDDEIGLAIDRLRVGESVEQSKEEYLQSGKKKGAKGGFDAITDLGRGLFKTAPPTATSAGAKYGLDAAELAALGTYTVDDYKYINPAAAYNKSWMQGNMAKSGQHGTEKERFEEGGTHAAIMSMAMAKLPPWKGAGFRGERLSQKKFAEKFDTRADGSVTAKSETDKRLAFTSVSRLREKSMEFATGAAGTPDADQTVHVLYFIKVRNTRDIQKFSALAAEAEVLCLPGATFKITKVVKLKTGPAGKPKATAWYEVFVTQVQ